MQKDIETEATFDPEFDIEQEEEPGIPPNPDGSVNVSQLDLFCAITAHLAKKHPGLMAHTRQVNAIKDAADLIVAAYAQPITKAEPGMGIEAWLASDDTGLSSLALARALCKAVGGHQPHIPQSRYSNGREHPWDPADFGRCVRLLDAVPVLREQLPAAGLISRTWAAYVARWDEMEALYREEFPTGSAPKLYALMQQIQDSVPKE